MLLKNEIIEMVIDQIKRDILEQETFALEILLDKLDINDLKSFLPENSLDF